MGAKKKSKKDLNDVIYILIGKVQVLENLVEELSKRVNLKDLETHYSEIVDTKLNKLEYKVRELGKQKENNIESKKHEYEKCDYVCSKIYEMKKHKIDKHPKMVQAKKCYKCEITFTKNCELVNHLKIHKEAETFECSKCDKTFVLQWRLRKHMSVHETERFCHYYNNEKCCPFVEIGCKFRHEVSDVCKFKVCKNLLCQYRHKDTIDHENASIEEMFKNDKSKKNVEMEVEKIHEISKCECDQQISGEIFRCEQCKKIFCQSCPSGPIKESDILRCLDCLFLDTTMYTSTPEKKTPDEKSPIHNLHQIYKD